MADHHNAVSARYPAKRYKGNKACYGEGAIREIDGQDSSNKGQRDADHNLKGNKG